MVGPAVSLPAKWIQFPEHLADDHEIDLNAVVAHYHASFDTIFGVFQYFFGIFQ